MVPPHGPTPGSHPKVSVPLFRYAHYKLSLELLHVVYLSYHCFAFHDRQGNYSNNLATRVIPFFIVSKSSVGEIILKTFHHIFRKTPLPRYRWRHNSWPPNFCSKHAWSTMNKALWFHNAEKTRYGVRYKMIRRHNSYVRKFYFSEHSQYHLKGLSLLIIFY